MWPLLFGLWKARRGRKAAVATIAPLVERSRRRLRDIPDSAWHDPYLVGFMMMLITLSAQREVDEIDTQALGLAQCRAWSEITGMNDDVIGEETLHLCETEDREFERGWRDAVTVDLALCQSASARSSDPGVAVLDEGLGIDVNAETAPDAENVLQLWEQYFEAQIMSHAAHRIVPARGSGAAHPVP
jgi:hypothetical protein